jgi:hypothetical protein
VIYVTLTRPGEMCSHFDTLSVDGIVFLSFNLIKPITLNSSKGGFRNEGIFAYGFGFSLRNFWNAFNFFSFLEGLRKIDLFVKL